MRTIAVIALAVAVLLNATSGLSCEPVSSVETDLDDATIVLLTVYQETSSSVIARKQPLTEPVTPRCAPNRMTIVVAGETITLPQNAFADLVNLQLGGSFMRGAVLTGTAQDMEIRLRGGDGGNSYRVIFRLVRGKLKGRKLYAFTPDGNWGLRKSIAY